MTVGDAGTLAPSAPIQHDDYYDVALSEQARQELFRKLTIMNIMKSRSADATYP
ncbi:hypothetical protein [Streptomyces sp. NEAU-YJ-81]|uniref:hypothetical protein n=1 Tax=Streptomyces sp. NEAU-YJ-81 TaxID=2820288 RepID=UPI001ABCD56E|nr:hypothetical protein [Streptomyces sp. NEAU-YJ-81]MBO3682514.1 hypothetical protein [Streptomyces sp. NEAU-YJ-81]